MNPVQYIILNRGLGMTTGKAAAQAAHASVEGVRISAKTVNGNPWDASIVNRWYRGGHYAKIVLEVDDGAAVQIARSYIEARGFKTSLIIDEGRTEIEPMSVTALGVEIVDKDQPHVRETFGAFKLYGNYDKAQQSLIKYCACPVPQTLESVISGQVVVSCCRCGAVVENGMDMEPYIRQPGRFKSWRDKVKENIQNP